MPTLSNSWSDSPPVCRVLWVGVAMMWQSNSEPVYYCYCCLSVLSVLTYGSRSVWMWCGRVVVMRHSVFQLSDSNIIISNSSRLVLTCRRAINDQAFLVTTVWAPSSWWLLEAEQSLSASNECGKFRSLHCFHSSILLTPVTHSTSVLWSFRIRLFYDGWWQYPQCQIHWYQPDGSC